MSELSAIPWITDAVTKGYIQVYSFDEFKMVGKDKGRFSKIYFAEWSRANIKVALKKLREYDVQKIAKEVKIHSICHSSKNVVNFLGLTKESPDIDSYIMVMEYAELNNLRAFLQERTNLLWSSKLILSLDIAKGLNYLHSHDIAHRDLHSSNIVIDRESSHPGFIAKIIDFGNAISMKDAVDSSGVVGQIAFTDPRYLNDRGNYKMGLKSDIYSLGVIFWEISSNKPPFTNNKPADRMGQLRLIMSIIRGLRENPVPHTPDDYAKLYQNCWTFEPSERPNIGQVIEALNDIYFRYFKKDDNGNEEDKIEHDINKNMDEIKHKDIINVDEIDTKIEYEIFNKSQITNIQKFINSRNHISSGVLSTNNSKVVIKKLRDDEITLESDLKNWFKISRLSYIIEFLGIVKDENNVSLVIPFVHEGNLRDYLKNKICTVKRKIEIAMGIANGIKYLHLNNIIHESLHPMNILMPGEIAQISDLPLPYERKSVTYYNENFFDNIGFLDPNSFFFSDFEKSKSMNIYSLGSLLWEIMSGEIPYSKDSNIIKLAQQINDGYREKDVTFAPYEYISLYKNCWNGDSSARPKIEIVFERLHILKHSMQ